MRTGLNRKRVEIREKKKNKTNKFTQEFFQI